MSALSEYLRALYQRSGLDQYVFAEAAGTSAGNMSKWLNGRSVPDLEQLVTMADGLTAKLGETVPLDRLIELRIGRPVSRSDDPDVRARRIALLIDAIPGFAEYAEGFLNASPAEQDAMLTYQELLAGRRSAKRRRRHNADQ